MALCGRTHRQGTDAGRPRPLLLLRRADVDSHVPPAGHPAGLAHHLRKPGRTVRAAVHESRRNPAGPHPAPPRHFQFPALHRLILLPERDRPGSTAQILRPHLLHEAEIARIGNPPRHLLQRNTRLQHLCGRKRQGQRHALRRDDLQHDGRIRRCPDRAGRLGRAPVHGRREAPHADPFCRRTVPQHAGTRQHDGTKQRTLHAGDFHQGNRPDPFRQQHGHDGRQRIQRKGTDQEPSRNHPWHRLAGTQKRQHRTLALCLHEPFHLPQERTHRPTRFRQNRTTGLDVRHLILPDVPRPATERPEKSHAEKHRGIQ